MLSARKHNKAINLIRRGADILAKSKRSVLIPDIILIQDYGVEYMETLCGPFCDERDIAKLIRYLADMMEE